MTLTELYLDSCAYCHSLHVRVEYEHDGEEWTKRVICANCANRKI
jgi:hypothetical protein